VRVTPGTARRRAGLALVLALGAAGLLGCGEVQDTIDRAGEAAGQVQGAADQAGDAVDQAGRLWDEARTVGELTLDQVETFDWSSLQGHWDATLGDPAAVDEFLRSMPSGPDIESVGIRAEDGALVVHYGEHVAQTDPAVLGRTMEDISAQAKQHIDGLETVEFRVGDEAYTF
jgi:hypothetical protein